MQPIQIILCSCLLTTFLGIVKAQPCPSLCKCTEGDTLMRCSNLAKLPDLIPTATKEAIFDTCMFEILPQIPHYENLEILLVSNSGVKNITESAFSQLGKLTTLGFPQNQLKTLDPLMFTGLQTLRNLDMGGNDITLFPSGLLNILPALELLVIADNTNLAFHEEAFQDTNIHHLNVENCGFNSVPISALNKATSLRTLELGDNHLTALGKHSFKGLNHLQTLSLVKCSIESIDEDAFEDLEDLKTLNLAYNKLSDLGDDTFDDFKHKLEKLYLQHNMLTTLNHDLVDHNGVLSEIGVAGNQWTCDCAIKWMRNVQFFLENGENVTCSSPSNMAGMDLKNTTFSMDCPCGYSGDCSDGKKIALYIAIPILIVCVLLIGYYIYKIFKNKKERAKHKSVRYSEVYRETTESTPKKEPLV